MANFDIKEYAKENNVRLWEVANHLGVTDATFSRKLRKELPDEVKAKIISFIDDKAKGGE